MEGKGAQLDWDENGQPISQQFGDVYFSKHHGLEETRYVFLQSNNLEQRFSQLAAGEHFIIGETGFGTGLNFLATWQLWQKTAPAQSHLHFISCEKYPLHKQDLIRALQLWPELQDLAAQLIKAYPPLPCGDFLRLIFTPNVSLTLLLQDAIAGFQQLLPQVATTPNVAQQLNTHAVNFGGPVWAVDAWFLDGFAPAKNPDMWQANLFFTLARLSKPGTRFATFTAAALVKQGLSAAGFAWQKQPGFGRKRDMLLGELQPLSCLTPEYKRQACAWHLVSRAKTAVKNEQKVAVIGAGLAGCHTAAALAHKGLHVDVFEAGTLAQGASGNPQGVVYAKLSHLPEAFAEFNLTAYLFACAFYHRQGLFKNAGDACGVLQLANGKNAEAFAAIAQTYAQTPDFLQACSPAQASELAGIHLAQGGLFFPQSGWLNPGQVCRQLLAHQNIQLHEHTAVTQLHYEKNHWHVERAGQQDNTTTEGFSHVVLACAEQTQHFSQAAFITSKPIRGQITQAWATSSSDKLKTVICGEGYIAPAFNGQHCVGATFNPKSASLEILPEDEAANIRQAQALSSDLQPLIAQSNRTSLRNVTPDYLPIIGPVIQAQPFVQEFAALRTNLKASIDKAPEYFPNLFVNLGHGSRGLTYTPLCAEILSSLIAGVPLPVSRQTFLQLHAARFLVRDLSRGKI